MKDKSGKPFDLNRLTRYDLHSRPSKVGIDSFYAPYKKGSTFSDFLGGLPKILAADSLRELADAIVVARKGERPVHLSMGAHVLKVGLAPLLIDLMERSVITSLSINGAGLIHDYEIAAAGKTSEDVDSVIGAGQFGMAEQTGRDLTLFIHDGQAKGLGLGAAVGQGLLEGEFPNKSQSLLAGARRLGVPLTCHPALGTDILHMWPDLDWGLLGRAAKTDFLTFCGLVENFREAVYLNVGSAVVLPEVFLKAISATRNAGADHSGLVTADLDFFRHYRPQTNVVRRPTQGVGRGFALTGHHEIMLPLLFAAVVEGLD